ncbi:ABC transporter permease subunit [Rhodophyticola sp. CCM32]|uniref:ABC transporter permease subunit n=1 Tax=Rhodophyticola sp. CCM32 TaxID=2916397 RepID=UPI00143CCBFD
MQFYYSYQPVIDFFLLSLGFAYSQQIALRAGVFSIGTAAFAALGGYLVAILVTRTEMPIWLVIPAGAGIGAFGGYILSIPLARLRGAFVAIATLAFVKVIIALLLYFEDFTGGGSGDQQHPARHEHMVIGADGSAGHLHQLVGRAVHPGADFFGPGAG